MGKKIQKSGRPIVYTDKQLKDYLLNYVVKNPGRKINPLQLEKATGIKRHVWSRRMKHEIDALKEPNETDFGGIDGSLPLPNIIELVETHWNNKRKLIQALSGINELIQSSYEQALMYHTKCKEYEELEDKYSQEKKQVKQLKDRIKHLETTYLEVAVKATYKSIQKDEGLKNIIELKKSSDQPALSTDFKKNYKSLFE